MARFELTISPDYVANWGFKEALREIYQNALDQQALDPTNIMTSSISSSSITIRSAKSALDKASLLLGHSDKKDDAQTIGQFGEGYKLALIVLLRLGLKVKIHNYAYKETWVPAFHHSSKYNTLLLAIDVTKYRLRTPPDADLTWIIEGFTKEQLIEWRSFNLVTNSNYESMDLKGRQVLTEERHKGHVYVSGLFVCKSTEDLRYGYNLWPKDVKLDRDRGMVDSFDLKWNLSQLWAKHSDTPFITNLISTCAPEVSYIQHAYSPSIKTHLLSQFKEANSPNAVPVISQAEVESLKQRGFTGATIIVSPVIHAIIGHEFNAIKKEHRAPTPHEIIEEFVDTHSPQMSQEAYDALLGILEQSKTWRL